MPGPYLLVDSGDLPGPGLALSSAATSGLLDPTDQGLHPAHHLQDSQLPSGLILQGDGQGNVNILLLFIASSQFFDHGFEYGLIGEALQKLQRTNTHSTE